MEFKNWFVPVFLWISLFSKRCSLLFLHAWKYQERSLLHNTIDENMKYFIFTSLKHLLVSFNSQSRDQNFLFYFKKVIVCLFLFFITVCLNVSAWRFFHSAIQIQLFPLQWKTLAIPFSPQSRTLSAITGSKRIISNRELNIVPIKFLFKWSPRYLTRLPCSLVRYRGDNEKGNSIFTSNHELFCLLDKHYSPLLTRKVDYTKKWEFDIPSSTWQSGAEGEWRVSSWLAI